MKRVGLKRLAAATGIAVAGLLALVVLAIGVGYAWFAPRIGQYKPRVEQAATARLGVPVRIGKLSMSWSGWGPELRLQRVAILSADRGTTLASAADVRVDVSLFSFLSWPEVRPSAIDIGQPRLSVVRRVDGTLAIPGLPTANGGQLTPHEVVTALDRVGTVRIRDGEVVFSAPAAGIAGWGFRDLDATLDGSTAAHHASVAVNLPAAVGRRLEADATLSHRGRNADRWRWQGHVAVRDLKLASLQVLAPRLPVAFRHGALNLVLSVQGRGARPSTVRAAVRAAGVLPTQMPVANAVNALTADLDWQRTDTGWWLTGRDLRIARAGFNWPISQFEVAHDGAGWSGRADFLRLGDLSALAGWAPASRLPMAGRVAALAPHGEVRDLRFNWRDPEHFALHADFKKLGLHASGKLPGFAGLDGSIALNDRGGQMMIGSGGGELDFPTLFRGPLKLKAAQVPVAVTHTDAGWQMTSKHFALADDHLHTAGRFKVLLPAGGGAPRLDVEAQASGIDLVNKSRYLPVGIMPPSVTAWVDRSVKSGQVPHVEVVFRGAADAFPFRHGGGLFKVDFSLRDTRIKFDPQWPAVEHLDAEVEFKNEGLTAKVSSGNISGMQTAGTTARIADLAKPKLAVQGTARGDAADAMRFLKQSPIAKKFGPYISGTEAHGKLAVDVKIELPLANIDKFQVHGQAHLDGIDTTLGGLPQGFTALTGELDFANVGLDSPTGLTGRFLGSPVAISVHPAGDGSETTLIGIDGKTSAEALLAALGAKGADVAAGAFAWQARVALPNELGTATAQPLTVKVQSDLKGFALKLPPPFAKTAQQAVPTTAQLTLAGGVQLKAYYGNAVNTELHFASSTEGGRLRAGVIHFGAGRAKLPARGLTINGHLSKVSLAEWQKLVALGSGKAPSGAPPVLEADLTVDQVDAFGQHFAHVSAHLQPNGDGYELKLAGPDIAGVIGLPPAPRNAHPYFVDLDRLKLSADVAEQKGGPLKSLSPGMLPPLQFTSRNVSFGDRALGTVSFELLREPGGVVMPRFSASQKPLQIEMNGTWVVDDRGQQHTRVQASVRSADVAGALKALGLPAAITARKGRIDAEFNWLGPPTGTLVKRVNGTMAVRLDQGQLPEISPGAARLLGLLSLNALPRRLLFNFRDVFSKGFSYDTIGGDFTIIGGSAYTTNFHLDSTAADVRVVGRIGLAKEDYDEDVIINTSISSTLPVAAAIAGGPITGAALLLLTEIFKSPLKKATQLEYHVTGTWDNPVMKRVTKGPAKAPQKPQPGKDGHSD